MIDVYWFTEKEAAYNVEIEAFANDRAGLLADIIAQTSKLGVKLMAVSKFHPVEEIQQPIDAGQLLFGENRVQEACEKFPALIENNSDSKNQNKAFNFAEYFIPLYS